MAQQNMFKVYLLGKEMWSWLGARYYQLWLRGGTGEVELLLSNHDCRSTITVIEKKNPFFLVTQNRETEGAESLWGELWLALASLVLHSCDVLQILSRQHSAPPSHIGVSLLRCLWVSFSWYIRWYGFSFSSRTELLSSASCISSSWRDRCATTPAPSESPSTLMVVLRRSLKAAEEGIVKSKIAWDRATVFNALRRVSSVSHRYCGKIIILLFRKSILPPTRTRWLKAA